MDINGVYLEKPTNLLVPLNQNKIENKDFIKHLFQLEFLFENNMMSPIQFKNKLDKAFHNYIGEFDYREKNRIDLYQTEAFNKFLNKVIIQALGRICRTNMKAKNIYILADNAIKKYLNVNLPEDVIPVKEYDKLVEETETLMIKSDEIESLQILATRRSHRAYKYIQTKFRDYLLEKYHIRFKFPQNNKSKDYLFDNSLNIKYFGETETEAYYFVGDRLDKVKFSFKDACHIRKIIAVEGSKLIFKELLTTMDVDFVCTGQSTVIPFPFKYIREYQNTIN